MGRARAGWAQVEITPPLGLPMGGRGTRFTPGAAVLDPLYAQAIVLEDARGNRTLWISLDLVGVMASLSAPLCVEIAAYAGVPYEAVILNFAHTHSGPMSNFDCYPNDQAKPAALQVYEDALKEKLIQCQDLPGYLPTDELIPEGGYEVTQSSTYRKTGPGPLAVGVNASARARFVSLQRQFASNR